MEIGLVRDLAGDGHHLADGLGAGHHLRIVHDPPTRGWDIRSVAGAIASQVGDAMRGLRSKGATDFRLLLASPAPVALLIGRQLHALGSVSAYHRSENGDIIRAFSTAGRRT